MNNIENQELGPAAGFVNFFFLKLILLYSRALRNNAHFQEEKKTELCAEVDIFIENLEKCCLIKPAWEFWCSNKVFNINSFIFEQKTSSKIKTTCHTYDVIHVKVKNYCFSNRGKIKFPRLVDFVVRDWTLPSPFSVSEFARRCSKNLCAISSLGLSPTFHLIIPPAIEFEHWQFRSVECYAYLHSAQQIPRW